MSALDVEQVRKDFPIFEREVHGKRLTYLDSASSAQKPLAVIESMDHVYRHTYANVHRGVYTLSEETSAAYEAVRGTLARFLNARSEKEVVFVRNATEAINVVACAWARRNVHEGDAIVLTQMEHHANIVPWHILAAERGVELRWVPLADDYTLDTSSLDELLEGAKLFAFSAMSNVLGTAPDVRAFVDAAHARGALALVDACQHVPHAVTDVQAWDADFVACSAHKMLGPTGIGALWARESLLEEMPPFMGGGDMITDVRTDGFVANEVPWKFEAGTPAIVEVIGWGAAIDYLQRIGLDAVRAHERSLTAYALDALDAAFGTDIRIFGPRVVQVRGGAISFELDGVHPHDIAQILDEDGVCVRAGHHCAKPLMRRLGVSSTARASTYLYNDQSDIDTLVASLQRAHQFFAL